MLKLPHKHFPRLEFLALRVALTNPHPSNHPWDDILTWFKNQSSPYLMNLVFQAAREGRIEIFYLCCSYLGRLTSTNLTRVLVLATRHHKLEFLREVYSTQITFPSIKLLNRVLFEGAKQGLIEVMEFCREQAVRINQLRELNLPHAMILATKFNHLEFVRETRQIYGCRRDHQIFRAAITYSREEILLLLGPLDRRELNWMAEDMDENWNRSSLELCLKYGSYLNSVLRSVARRGDENLLHEILEKNPSPETLEESIKWLAYYGRTRLVTLLKQRR